ncbi:MAG: hypothetical protein M0004_02980 [Actinomycetota bacterium]|nr:hypothetical protein [Actinomycetota bacterium]
MTRNALALTPALVLTVALGAPPALAATRHAPRPAGHRDIVRPERSRHQGPLPRRVEVTTQFSATLTNLSGAAMGGTQQQVDLTLTPSVASAVYAVGTVTVAETSTACNPAATEAVPAANTTPGPDALATPLELAISFSPPCGGELTISYSGGTYRQGAQRYVFAPNTWTLAPNETNRPETLTQP